MGKGMGVGKDLVSLWTHDILCGWILGNRQVRGLENLIG